MSITTINAPSHTLSTILSDYSIHLSSTHQYVSVAQSDTSTPSPLINQNPSSWPTHHRRVPPYRPVNYDLDPAERIVYNSRVEQGFITTMFFGIRIITVPTHCLIWC